MLQKIRVYSWLPVAVVGVGLLWLLSAVWNSSHAYILAGGDSPLVILEGRWPSWNGTAMAMALASLGADIVKAVAGFILVAALFNTTLGWPKRVAAVTISLLICLPTVAWSTRGAIGMAALTFGDTIAGRGNEQMVTRSLRDQIEYDQGRLGFLAQQTTTNRTKQMTNAREAAELRKELEKNRKELRQAKGIGGADPGGKIIAETVGVTEERVTRWTFWLIVLVVELVSTLGFPALALATSLAGAPTSPEVRRDDARDSDKVAKVDEPPANSNGRKEKRPLKNGDARASAQASISAAPVELAPEPIIEEEEAADFDEAVEPTRDQLIEVIEPKPSRRDAKTRRRRKGRGRPPRAGTGDGHVQAFCEECAASGSKPEYSEYKIWCTEQYLLPMTRDQLRHGIKRWRRLGREPIRRYFDPERPFLLNAGAAH